MLKSNVPFLWLLSCKPPSNGRCRVWARRACAALNSGHAWSASACKDEQIFADEIFETTLLDDFQKTFGGFDFRGEFGDFVGDIRQAFKRVFVIKGFFFALDFFFEEMRLVFDGRFRKRFCDFGVDEFFLLGKKSFNRQSEFFQNSGGSHLADTAEFAQAVECKSFLMPAFGEGTADKLACPLEFFCDDFVGIARAVRRDCGFDCHGDYLPSKAVVDALPQLTAFEFGKLVCGCQMFL